MPSLCDHSLSTWVLSLLLGSYCLVASIGSRLGIIYSHDGNHDDVSPVLSMFMLFVLLITRLYVSSEHGEPPRKIVQPQYYMARVLAD
jgi:hypothetical protein